MGNNGNANYISHANTLNYQGNYGPSSPNQNFYSSHSNNNSHMSNSSAASTSPYSTNQSQQYYYSVHQQMLNPHISINGNGHLSPNSNNGESNYAYSSLPYSNGSTLNGSDSYYNGSNGHHHVQYSSQQQATLHRKANDF